MSSSETFNAHAGLYYYEYAVVDNESGDVKIFPEKPKDKDDRKNIQYLKIWVLDSLLSSPL